MTIHLLTLQCADRPGIVASLSNGLVEMGANILENAQFSEPTCGEFVMRTRFEVDIDDASQVREQLAPRAAELGAAFDVRREDHRPRVLIMVSKFDHCLRDLLYRWSSDELAVDIPLIVSNHPDLQPIAERYDIPFAHVPVTPETKPEAEAKLLAMVEEHGIELVVLARYMQILSDGLCEQLRGRAINIHHSFLPGFKGAKPYHQAWERGVKLIGATAHYVTGDLDEGPIIDQDVERVSHAQSAEQLTLIGRDVERLVLSRAVRAHVESRVFLVGARTVVFP